MEDAAAGSVSWIAVIVGAVVSFLVGWFWYSPKGFGTKWAEGVGVSLQDASKMPPQAMVIQFLGMLFMSWLIGLTAASNALFTAILVILAIACLIVANGYFAQKSQYSINVEGGFIVICGVIMIVCQGIF